MIVIEGKKKKSTAFLKHFDNPVCKRSNDIKLNYVYFQ